MRSLLVATGVFFIACVLVMLTQRIIVQTNVTSDTFMQQLIYASRMVDEQWTWREIYPGRDTMTYALHLLQDGTDDFSQQIKINNYPSNIDWRTSTSPQWAGSILSDNDLPPPHVYAIVFRLPQGQVKLGEVVLTYGTPLNSPGSYGNTRNLCFDRGVCITIDRTQQPTRILPDAEVKSITYLPSKVVERSLSDIVWRGFRRY